MKKDKLHQSYNELIKKNNNSAILIFENGDIFFGFGFVYFLIHFNIWIRKIIFNQFYKWYNKKTLKKELLSKISQFISQEYPLTLLTIEYVAYI